MAISGQVFMITDAAQFFGPILNGETPAAGFEPWGGLEVGTWVVSPSLPSFFSTYRGPAAVTDPHGAFSISAALPNPQSLLGEPDRFGIQVSSAGFPFTLLYRSDLSLVVSEADHKDLNIWLLPPSTETSTTLSAGAISAILAHAGLPSDTYLTSGPGGLQFQAATGDIVVISFTVAITPDTSFDLTRYVDLRMTSSNISVGGFDAWCTDADAVLAEVESDVQSAMGAANNAVAKEIVATLETFDPALTGPQAEAVVAATSTSVTNLTWLRDYSWLASTTDDTTPVLTATACLGYPHSLSEDPPKGGVLAPPRLSRPFRPVTL